MASSVALTRRASTTRANGVQFVNSGAVAIASRGKGNIDLSRDHVGADRMALFSCSAAFRKSGIHQDGDDVSLRHHVIEQLSRFAANSSMRKLMPVMLPPGRFKLGGLVAIIFVTAINPGVTMKMGNFIMALAAVALGLTPARTAAETIPPQLIGHSVVVKWTADRQTRAAGQVHNNRTAFEINLYISTSGRTFSRWHVLGHDGQGHSDQG